METSSDEESDNIIIAAAAAAVTSEVKFTKNVELKSEGVYGTLPFTTYIKDDRIIRIETKVENEEEFCIEDYSVDEEMPDGPKPEIVSGEPASPRIDASEASSTARLAESPGDVDTAGRTSVISRSRSSVIKQTVSQHRSVLATSVFHDGTAVTGRMEEVVVLGTAVIHLPSSESKNGS